jgi:hypothetical protein
MGCIDLAIGGIGFKTPDSATGAGLITVCSFWVLIYSLSLAPIGESDSLRTLCNANGTRMGFGRGNLKSSSAGQDSRRRYHRAILVKHPLRTCSICVNWSLLMRYSELYGTFTHQPPRSWMG